jgi:hypothetical protein
MEVNNINLSHQYCCKDSVVLLFNQSVTKHGVGTITSHIFETRVQENLEDV